MNEKVTYIQVDTAFLGQRVDNFLLARFKNVPKSHLYRLIRRGEVRVNKKRVKPANKLVGGDLVRVPPIKQSSTVMIEKKVSPKVVQVLKKSVLYDNANWMVLNKPSGFAVHGGSGLSFGIIEVLRQIYNTNFSLELVHRLDKETSGCLIVAKKRSVLRYLHALFRDKAVKKVYVALLSGRWQGANACTVEAPLKRTVLPSGERIVKVNEEEGKGAVTHFKLLENYSSCCLVEARPLTGRTHQIRVHARHLGHPIVGDEKYGDFSVNKMMHALNHKRLFLHAKSLFFLDSSQKKQCYEAPLPLEFDFILNYLRRY